MESVDNFNVSYWDQNKDHCAQLLSQHDFINKIPNLNKENLKSCVNKLVRFRGMVQDTLNPVFYFEKCQVFNSKTGTYSIRSGKYRDVIACEDDEEVMANSNENTHQEKHVIHCVRIPGLNSWTRQFKYTDDQNSVNVRNEKRKLSDAENEETMEMDSNDVNKKQATETIGVGGDVSSTEDNSVKCDASSSNDMNVDSLPEPAVEEFDGCESCLLNFYDVNDTDIKVNDIIEVIGFLSVDNYGDSEEEESSVLSALPRIHVIRANFGVSTFSNMLQFHKEHVFQTAQQLRDELWLMFTDILAGDTLAADYLICHLISSVYSRQDLLALGKFSLNLSNVPFHLCNSAYVNELYKLLSHLLEKSYFMPISIQYLNNAVMVPKKDYDQNRLKDGELQLSSNTHLIIDETQLQPGQLIDKGVRNVQALGDVITNQKIDYDFEFYSCPFYTNIPVLTFSEGKSLLPSDCLLVMEPDTSCVENIDEAFARTWKKMSDPLLSKLRVYLNNISSLPYDLSPSMQQIIQDDFVKMRQENSKMNADDLHNLLVLSRLLSISRGMQTLQKNIWDYACRLENQRKDRIR